jgi:hypothetical protein
MEDRYFYHSFPRRATVNGAIKKGCQILSAIRDSGLLLVPEYIEWKQPTSSGPRIFPVLQKRVCFTELSPSELPEHAAKFGQFALEFDAATVRRLGAIPVFYLPQPTADGLDGNALGVALLSAAMDAGVIIHRLAGLDEIFKGSTPVAEQLAFNPAFARNPENRGSFIINTAEAKNLLNAVSHMTTPWGPLHLGVSALMNFFYPADDTKHDRLLEYYRQREWRIACAFAIKGVEILRVPTQIEKDRFLEIDPTFFGREIQTDLGGVKTLDQTLVHAGMDGNKLIEMARRIIVPAEAIDEVRDIVKGLTNPPTVMSDTEVASQ